jgi:glycosyltransferase involved in cell wall biosynthesis
LAELQAASLLASSGVKPGSAAFKRSMAEPGVKAMLADVAKRRRTEFLREDPTPRKPEDDNSFARRRIQAVQVLNRGVDLHLAVSERVARVLGKYGIAPSRTHVSYIGTKQAAKPEASRLRRAPLQAGMLSIAYLGYMRADKGFYFLMDALEALPPSVAQGLRVTLAARSYGDHGIEQRIRALSQKLGGVTHVDGYGYADLPDLLADIDLGVVPVLWEDNLPQVAIEIMGQGVPVLTSDMGGAQELGANPDFVFAAGSKVAFAEALRRIQSGEVALGDFWTHAMWPRSMEAHLADLTALYAQGRDAMDAGASPAGSPAERAAVVLDMNDLDDARPAAALNLGWL